VCSQRRKGVVIWHVAGKSQARVPDGGVQALGTFF
jgi:hypothetical protein